MTAEAQFHFFIGTKAQCIKMAPVMAEMDRRGIPYRYVDSGQHAAMTQSLRKIFGLKEPDVMLRSADEDIVNIAQAGMWYASKLAMSFDKMSLRRNIFPGGGVCLIHGDTLSTLLGMQMAKRAGLKVAHVESGLRSFKILDPFPEELIRIWCMRNADILFAPSQEAVDNLKAMRKRGKPLPGTIVPIGANTVWDSLRMANDCEAEFIPDEPFGIVTCHRLETLTSKSRLQQIVKLLNRAAQETRIVFVMHKPTQKAFAKYGLKSQLHDSIRTLGSLDYQNFMSLVRRADFVLTDGGSIQEECALLNKPCLILRNNTERRDGLGKNAMLWQFDEHRADEFFSHRKSIVETAQPDHSPSSLIVDELLLVMS